MLAFNQHLIGCAVSVCSWTIGQLAQDCGWAKLEARGATIRIHHLQEFGQIIMGGFRRWSFLKKRSKVFTQKPKLILSLISWALLIQAMPNIHHSRELLPPDICSVNSSFHICSLCPRLVPGYWYERILIIGSQYHVSLAREKPIPEKVFSVMFHYNSTLCFVQIRLRLNRSKLCMYQRLSISVCCVAQSLQ